MIKKTVCPLDCPDSCGLLAIVEDGKVTKLTGDPEHPFTKGFICKKMKRYVEKVYSARRVTHPLLRTGEKGAAEFKRITWEEAWRVLVERLTGIIDQHGGKLFYRFVMLEIWANSIVMEASHFFIKSVQRR